MEKVKEFVRTKLQERGRSTEDAVIAEFVRRGLKKACKMLPGGLKNSESKLSQEFVKIMFEAQPAMDRESQIERLVGRVMDDRDDLALFPEIRRVLVIELETAFATQQ